MFRTLYQRVFALAGIAMVVMVVAEIVLSPDSGSPGDSAGKILSLNASGSSAILGWSWVGFLTTLLFLAFAARLRSAIPTNAESTIPASLVVFGAIGFASLESLNHVFTATLAYDAPHHPGLAIVSALFDASTMSRIASMLPLSVFVAGASMAALQNSSLPRAIGMAGLAVAGVQIVSTGAVLDPNGGFSALGVIALLLTLLWILATSVVLSRQGDASHETASSSSRAPSLAIES